MKIDHSTKNTTGLGIDKSGAGKLDALTGQKTDKSQTDLKAAENVTLSPMSAQLKSLEDKVNASNVFDAEKVDAIKTAIAGGQFKVNSEKVADGLIQTVKDILTTK